MPQNLWNFQLLVDRSSRPAAADEQTPQRGGPATTVALLHRTNPQCDLEILGQWLQFEIHPADWLDLWLAEARIRPISEQYVRMPGGTVGDVVGTWTTNNVQWIGRFFCLKAGGRLFLLCFRAAAVDYPHLADDFFVSISSFSVADQSPGPFAEQTTHLETVAPIRMSITLPASWTTKIESADESLWAFEANLMVPGEPAPRLLGKLSFAAGGPDQVANHEDAFSQAMEAVTAAGLIVPPTAPQTEPAPPPFTESWLSVSPASLGGQKTQVRCRVMRHPGAWIVAVAVSLDAKTSPQGWMRVKRALDLATSTIEFIT